EVVVVRHAILDGERRVQLREVGALLAVGRLRLLRAQRRARLGDDRADVHALDGAVKGVDIGAIITKARSALGSQQAQAADGKERTDFSELNATFAIKNGVAHNDDLDVKAPLFRVSGAGEIDVAKSAINYVVKAAVVATTKGQ